MKNKVLEKQPEAIKWGFSSMLHNCSKLDNHIYSELQNPHPYLGQFVVTEVKRLQMLQRAECVGQRGEVVLAQAKDPQLCEVAELGGQRAQLVLVEEQFGNLGQVADGRGNAGQLKERNEFRAKSENMVICQF